MQLSILEQLRTFLNDDLLNEYVDFVETNRVKRKSLGCEVHHILPICKNGPDIHDNRVLLKGKDHYLAHKILSKSGDTQMWSALSSMMMGRQNQDWFTPEIYEECRKAAAIACGERFRGKKLTPEHKVLISQNHPAKTGNEEWLSKCGKHMVGRKRPEFGKKISEIQTGRPHKESRKKNISISQSKRMQDPTERRKCSDGAKRRFEDPEQRRLASIAAKNRPKGRFWINNGTEESLVLEISNDMISKGFKRGRLNRKKSDREAL